MAKRISVQERLEYMKQYKISDLSVSEFNNLKITNSLLHVRAILKDCYGKDRN